MVLKVSIMVMLVGEFVVKELCGPLTLLQQACTESDNETMKPMHRVVEVLKKPEQLPEAMQLIVGELKQMSFKF